MIIRGALITGNPAEPFIPDGVIVIDGGVIQSVEPFSAVHHDAYVFPDHWIMPGLINGHSHCAMTLFRGAVEQMSSTTQWLAGVLALEKKLSPRAVELGVEIGMLELINRGVTTTADMYPFPAAVARAAQRRGMRAIIGAHIASEANLEDADDFVASWQQRCDRITCAYAPHTLYALSPHQWSDLIECAVQQDVQLLMHCAEERIEAQRVQEEYGSYAHFFDTVGISHVRSTFAHGVHFGLEDLDWIARNRCGIIHCPTSNLKLSSGVAPLPTFLAHNVSVGLGTDSAASNNRLSMLRETALAALLPSALNPPRPILTARAALDLATIGGAAALHSSHRVGSLESGKRADLIVLRNRQLHQLPAHDPWTTILFASEDEDITDVMIDGIWHKREGQLSCPPAEVTELLREFCSLAQ